MITCHFLFGLLTVAILITTSEVRSAIPENVSIYLNVEAHRVSEDGVLYSSQMPETLDFVRSVTANWREIFEEMPLIAGDGRRQSLIIVAGEYLRPEEYVTFVDSLCDLRAQGKLVPEVLRFVPWAGMIKEDFLSYNYDQPKVAAVIEKLEHQIVKDYPNDWNEYFQSLVSGKLKEESIKRRKSEGRGMPESFVGNESKNYQRLVGGNVAQDVKLLATRPVEAVASLASKNRTNWSMYVALVLVLGGVAGLLSYLSRKRKAFKESRISRK